MTEDAENVGPPSNHQSPLAEMIRRCKGVKNVTAGASDPAMKVAYAVVSPYLEFCEYTSDHYKSAPTPELERECADCVEIFEPLVKVVEAIVAELSFTADSLRSITDPKEILKALRSVRLLMEKNGKVLKNWTSGKNARKSQFGKVWKTLNTALKVYGAFNGAVTANLFDMEETVVEGARVFQKVFNPDASVPLVAGNSNASLQILLGSLVAVALGITGLIGVTALYDPGTAGSNDEKHIPNDEWLALAACVTVVLGGLAGGGFAIYAALSRPRFTRAANNGTP